MALETKLYQKLSQQLVMTPQLRQAIKILQVSRAELESLIQDELCENPVLEESAEVPEPEHESRTDESADNRPASTEEWIESGAEGDRTTEIEPNADRLAEIDWREYLNNYSNDWQGSSQTAADFDDDDKRPIWETRASPANSLAAHLIWQLRLGDMPREEEAIVTHLIGNLDEDGYLHIQIEDVAFTCGADFDLVETALRRIQSLEPAGVGARNLRECLLLQIAADDQRDELAEPIVREHLGLLEARRFDKIAKELAVPMPEVAAAAAYIGSLEPKPGRDYDSGDVRYIVPDVYVHKIGDELQISLNDDGLPRLRVSNYYRHVLADEGSGEAKRYIQDKMRSAAWLIKSIHQRQRTLTLVAESIVRFQRAFFEHGVTHLKPLVLKDVANDIGMHESTVSRATANKYVHTPQGTYELKYFFTASLQGPGGDEVSAESVRERIRAIIEAESPKKPLSDQQIVKMLAEENVAVARRTVAKYREQMGILPSSQRRKAL